MNTSISKKRREELAPPEPKPVVTVLLVLTAWFLPFIATMAKGDKSVWTGTQGLTANKFFELLSNNDMSGLIGSMLLANFAQLSFWIYLLSAFFIWSFGSVIERIMGNVRFMILALLGIFGGWAILAHEAYAVQPDLPFIGPTNLTLFLVGAYLLFLPRKPYKPTDWVKPSWKIFRDEKPESIDEKYWISPWTKIIAFGILTVMLQMALTITRTGLEEVSPVDWAGNVYEFFLGKIDSPMAVTRPLAAIEVLFAGLLSAALIMMVTSVRRKAIRPGGELQWETVQHYRQLRALDYTHEQAIQGASKFVSVPYEVAKDWIGKGTSDDDKK